MSTPTEEVLQLVAKHKQELLTHGYELQARLRHFHNGILTGIAIVNINDNDKSKSKEGGSEESSSKEDGQGEGQDIEKGSITEGEGSDVASVLVEPTQ
jgi:hypothetical protein